MERASSKASAAVLNPSSIRMNPLDLGVARSSSTPDIVAAGPTEGSLSWMRRPVQGWRQHPVLLGYLDIQQFARLVVDLKGRVVQVELVVQHPLQPATRGVTVVLAADEHVRRERGETGGDLPDVQVVNLDHTGLA